MRRVLILEDEANIRSFVVINLKRAGYDVIEAATGYEALEKLREFPDINVAILDVMLPDIDGFEVCRRIRAGGMKIGVLMLTARSQETDKINGLMTGADDYVTKPFSPAELIARIDALFRRIGFSDQAQPNELISRGPFQLNLRTHTLQKNGENGSIGISYCRYSQCLGDSDLRCASRIGSGRGDGNSRLIHKRRSLQRNCGTVSGYHLCGAGRVHR